MTSGSYRVGRDEPSRRDPLLADEWWLAQIGIDGLTPPGPGVPVTVVDSGLDFSHPEFAGRADTLGAQPAGAGPARGRARDDGRVGVGAPVNGVGIVGIYPEAVLRSWDAAKGAGRELESSEIVGGILAAARRRPRA